MPANISALETAKRFDFLDDITRSQGDFRKTVLLSFSRIFGYHKSVFWEIDNFDPLVLTNPVTLNIHYDEITEYFFLWNREEDPIRRYLNRLARHRAYCYSDFLTFSEYSGSQFYAFVQKQNVQDILSVPIGENGRLLGVVSLLRLNGEEQFTVHDKNRLRFLSRFITNLYRGQYEAELRAGHSGQWARHQAGRQVGHQAGHLMDWTGQWARLRAEQWAEQWADQRAGSESSAMIRLQAYADLLSVGYIAIDPKNRIIRCNRHAMNICRELSGSRFPIEEVAERLMACCSKRVPGGSCGLPEFPQLRIKIVHLHETGQMVIFLIPSHAGEVDGTNHSGGTGGADTVHGDDMSCEIGAGFSRVIGKVSAADAVGMVGAVGAIGAGDVADVTDMTDMTDMTDVTDVTDVADLNDDGGGLVNGQRKNSDLAGRLTEREMEIAGLLIRGLTYSQISQKLYISINTVKRHTQNIFNKVGVKNRTELGYVMNYHL